MPSLLGFWKAQPKTAQRMITFESHLKNTSRKRDRVSVCFLVNFCILRSGFRRSGKTGPNNLDKTKPKNLAKLQEKILHKRNLIFTKLPKKLEEKSIPLQRFFLVVNFPPNFCRVGEANLSRQNAGKKLEKT